MGDLATQRPPAAASGTLAKTPLLHLLVYAFDKKLAGTMDVVSPDRRVASVLFVAGEPAKAHVSEPVSYLGQVLVELGYMTAEVLDRTLAELEDARGADERPLYGEFLLEKGLVDAVGVEAGFREQMIRRLRHVAAMPPDTTYAYYDGFDALRGIGERDPRGIDPLPMLWTLLRESAPRTHVDAALARVAGCVPSNREDRQPGSARPRRRREGRHRAAPCATADGGRVPEDQRARRARRAAARVSAAGDEAGRRDLRVAPVDAAARKLDPEDARARPNAPPPAERLQLPPSPRSISSRSLIPPGEVSRSRPPPGARPRSPSAGRRSSTVPARSIAATTSSCSTSLGIRRRRRPRRASWRSQ